MNQEPNLFNRRNLLMGALLLLLLRLPAIPSLRFKVDELQHLHVARSLAAGQVMYVDFFEHHTPLFHLLLSPLFSMMGDEILTLFASRWLMFILNLGFLWVMHAIATRVQDSEAAAVAVLFLVASPLLWEKTSEVRPAVLLMFFLAVAVYWAMQAGTGRAAAGWASGVALGAAVMTTQKAFPIALCLILGVVLNRRLPGVASFIAGGRMLAGSVAVGGVAAFLMSRAGNLHAFLTMALDLNLNWRYSFSPWGVFTAILAADPFIPALGVAWLLSLFERRRDHAGDPDKQLLIMVLIGSAALIYLVPEPYLQTFVPLIGFLALPAAFMVTGYRACPSWLRVVISFLVTGEVLLHHKLARITHPQVVVRLLQGLVVLALLWAVHEGSHRWRRIAAAGFLGTLLSVGVMAQLARSMTADAGQQLWLISYIRQRVPDGETVLDGWTGLGVLRDHACYYWFFHRGVLTTIDGAVRDRVLLEILRDRPPWLILYDQPLSEVSDGANRCIRACYHRTVSPQVYEPGPPMDEREQAPVKHRGRGGQARWLERE
ncbi:glycosyltransferase family 39 protein [bacterium]|nr:glycosyltransferase family 39 protein [candidate division CSSED10-310 bacterium]